MMKMIGYAALAALCGLASCNKGQGARATKAAPVVVGKPSTGAVARLAGTAGTAGAPVVPSAPLEPIKEVVIDRSPLPQPPRGTWLSIVYGGNGQGEIEPCG